MNEINLNTERTKRYFYLLAKRSLKEILELFAEDVHWYVPGNRQFAPWTGHRHTRTEVEKFFEELWANTEPLDGQIFHHAAVENVVISSGQFQSRMLPTGKVYTSLFFTEIIYHEGLIIKYTLLEDSGALTEALTLVGQKV